MSDKKWDVKLSYFGEKTVNPLRAIWENPKWSEKRMQSKSRIILQAGDPTVHGVFKPHPECYKALNESLIEETFSYDDCPGAEPVRNAVAKYSSHLGDIKSDDVILTSGVSMALEMCFLSLANPGDNILIPRPGFMYGLWFVGAGIIPQYYNLDPEKDWNVDLKHMESLINERTKAIVVNSPGNPCGQVFSKEHILEIIDIAEKHKLPIISDEVYEFFTFPGVDFHSFATLSKNVPVIVCSGVTKRFIMPGMRLGWLIINDRGDKLKEIRRGLFNISGRNFLPNSTVQRALPRILNSVPQSYFDENYSKAEVHATLSFKLLQTIPGLKPIMPKGAFYMMIGIDFEKFPTISTSLDFMRQLKEEQNVYIFPGEPFYYPGFFRIVLTAPEDTLVEACERIKEFCAKHYQNKSLLNGKQEIID